MSSTRTFDTPVHLPPLRAAALPPRRLRQRLVSVVARVRTALVVIDVDFGDLGLDDATLHADLADLFERRTG